MSIRREKIQFFEQCLTDFFQKAGRAELPWRKKHRTAYEVWVSEIMLQQTQVVRVIGFYTNFLQRFPNVQTLAAASWEDFLPYYQGLGYYARGRNMMKTAQKVAGEFQGVFPRDKKVLETLPGVGPYTAAAIMSFAYGENHLAWDTNLKRVIGRFFFGGKQGVTDETYWEERFTLPKREMNAALMDFGSALCTARPKCAACSLRHRCTYYKEGGKQETSEKNPKTIEAAGIDWGEGIAYVFLHENHQRYYSSSAAHFRPFILPRGCVTRTSIRRYFEERYHLTLAIRPPHQKFVSGKQGILLVNAQILLGEPHFPIFSKMDREEYNRKKKR